MSAQPDPEEQRERHWGIIDLIGLVLVVAFVVTHIYRGVTTGTLRDPAAIRSFGIVVFFLVGFGLYFTSYWRPALFAVWAVIVGALTVFFFLHRPVSPLLETIRVGLGSAVSVILLYLLARERIYYEL